MKRTTIDFGIDLGTTNSAISVIDGTESVVIKNNQGDETTPSAVYMDKKGTIHVGDFARKRLDTDHENAFSEFKRQMGTEYVYTFQKSGREMLPEELSAEVIKSLKDNVRQRYSEEIHHAVITVPAAFELPQNEATNKAAKLAGFEHIILLQEPVAAALAYGFQEEKENVFWLVYDLGGGTFDAALIQIREGSIRVVDHEGDNHLGGKDIDWEIVQKILVPELTDEYDLPDFTRANSKWITAFAKLKIGAEEVKIHLSKDHSSELMIEYLGNDGNGNPMSMEIDIDRDRVEQIARPFIVRTINICRELLERNNLKPSDVEKTALVGGPTLMPQLRQMLADKKDGLGIKVDFSADPLTAVAQGAGIFAGTNRVESSEDVVPVPGGLSLRLEYKPVGSEEEPLVGGVFKSDDVESFQEYTIQFLNKTSQPSWDSGKIPISENGTFMTNLWAQKGEKNVFDIFAFNPGGIQVPTSPDSMEYTIGLAFSNPPLTHSLGIAMADNRVDIVFPKGTSLPARKRVKHSTIKFLSSGGKDEVLIPIVEGQNVRADRNPNIGAIVIQGFDIKRDMPAGCEVEVIIEIDQSRLVSVTAYVPILDQEFLGAINLRSEQPEPDFLRKDFAKENKRLKGLQDKLENLENKKAAKELGKIKEEGLLQEIEDALEAVDEDNDAAQKCNDRIRKIKAALDKIEDAIEWPAMLEEAEHSMEFVRNMVNDHGSQEERKVMGTLLADVKKAIDSRDIETLKHSIERMDDFGRSIFWRQPSAWIGAFNHATERKDDIKDQQLAETLFQQGRKAIETNKLDELEAVCRQLFELLPSDELMDMRGYGGGTIKI